MSEDQRSHISRHVSTGRSYLEKMIPGARQVWATIALGSFLLIPAGAYGQEANLIVVGELLRFTSGPPCGRAATVGEFEYRVVSVERGRLPAARVVVEVLCPALRGPYHHLARLHLSERRRFPHRPGNRLTDPPPERRYLIRAERVAQDYAALLGRPEQELSQFTQTDVREGWRFYGPGLQARVEEGRVARIRFRCPPGFPRTFEWAGLREVTWERFQRRGGYSNGRFRAAGNIRGEARRGFIEIFRSPP